MSRNELIAKIEALNEWEAVIEEAKAEAEAIRDSIKQEMLERETEELTAGQYIVRWTSVLTNRFDTTAFKKTYGDLYKAFTKQSASRRSRSAHEKSPLPECRPKLTGKELPPQSKRRGQGHYSLPSLRNQEQERKRHEGTDELQPRCRVSEQGI